MKTPIGMIMAGGKGRRMHPYTVAVPKALLPIGPNFMLDILVSQLARGGCGEVVVSLGHLASVIRAYILGHDPFPAPVRCVEEFSPLGTAGALSLLDPKPDLALVVNCDVLSDVDFSNVIRQHQERGADLTVVGVAHRHRMSYGVLEVDGTGRLIEWREGADVESVIAGGAYLVGAKALAMVKRDELLDMPTLVSRVKGQGGRVDVYTHTGAWFDVGTLDSHLRGVEAFMASPGQFGFTPSP